MIRPQHILATTASALFCYLISPSPAIAQQSILQAFGELTALDERVDPEDEADLRVYDIHTFTGTYDQTVRITAQSITFDTYLVLISEDVKLIDKNDDRESGLLTTNSQITTTLPLNGLYTVLVTGYGNDDRGQYTLTVTDITEEQRRVSESVRPSFFSSPSNGCEVVRCPD